ncbi:uncharacterized protein LOC107205480 isoform X1 [Parus major]|uniref:uncharacterized protein LOC107205480 isoform X1 n=1 Tax=Parus major TaxID=9157 RepID=UPI00077111BA|nr:uncharacterized protein LOC107205480 isoform X1 [Parus major]
MFVLSGSGGERSIYRVRAAGLYRLSTLRLWNVCWSISSRISSKIKASPKSNRIAVTDFHGTVKREGKPPTLDETRAARGRSAAEPPFPRWLPGPRGCSRRSISSPLALSGGAPSPAEPSRPRGSLGGRRALGPGSAAPAGRCCGQAHLPSLRGETRPGKEHRHEPLRVCPLPIKLQKRSALIFTLEFSVRREQYTPTSFEMIRRLSQHTSNHSKHEIPLFFFFLKKLLGPLFEVGFSAQPKEKRKKKKS